jgi:hypothetical protein
MGEEGRESMIEELQGIAKFFENVDSKFTAIVEEYGKKQGITEEVKQRTIQKPIDRE